LIAVHHHCFVQASVVEVEAGAEPPFLAHSFLACSTLTVHWAAAPKENCDLCLQASVVDVEAGAEPPFFTQFFLGWDSEEHAIISDVYADKLRIQEQREQQQ
jgi:hypothetical protein